MSNSGHTAVAPIRRLLAALAAASLAAACGGGGDSGEDNGTENPASSAEGFYLGTMAGGTLNYFEQLVLDNSEVWLLYGTRASSGSGITDGGMMSGTGTYSGGTLTVTAMKDFGATPTATGTFNASYKINSKSFIKSVSGAANVGSKSLTFTGNDHVSNYLYWLPATLSTLSGTWTLPSASGAPGALSVNSAGAFSLSFGGCAGSGTMAPRASGKNVYNVTLTFGAAPCSFPGTTFGGIAFVASSGFLSGGTAGELRVLLRNGAQTVGLIVVGTR